MSHRIDDDWLRGRASLGAAGGWTTGEMRLVTDLGYALAEQGRHQEALTIFEGLAALAPATAYFQSALGALRLRVGDPVAAITHLDAALAADARDVAALVNRGEANMQLGNTEAAQQDLQTAARLGEALQASDSALSLTRARALLARLQSFS